VSAENSMVFHAPQEAARILAEAIDYARQSELAVARARGAPSPSPEAPSPKAPSPSTEAPSTPTVDP